MSEKIIGQVLKKIREDQNLYQYDVAERLNIAKKNVHALEQRKDMKLSTLKKYVEALGGELNIWIEFEDQNRTYKISEHVNE
ncbi:MAG: XRE family transcriptional regulator [Rickettsiaceae bacterium]|nr:XRE family transcriptional regulator [Rickettsiaceae bacterium]